MVGLIILAVAAIYIVGWVFVVKLVKQRWLKIAAILIALAIPLGDVPYGYGDYLLHCRRDGGVKVFSQFAPARGLYFPTVLYQRPEILLREEVVLIEYGGTGNNLVRIRKTATGTERITTQSQPESEIRIRLLPSQVIAPHLTKREAIGEDTATRAVLVGAQSFTWRGNWLWRQLPLSAPARCHASYLDDLLDRVVKGSRAP